MDLSFILEAFFVLFLGFCLLRIVGKKTVGEMTGLEIITLLAMASMIGHAIAGNGFWKTLIILCLFVTMLITVQFLALKYDWVEKWFMGKATLVINDGQIIPQNLKKLRLSVDQLEAMLRTKGISSFTDVKRATIEISGHMGYELMRHAKPVTISELENILFMQQKPQPQKQSNHLFKEVENGNHEYPIPEKLD